MQASYLRTQGKRNETSLKKCSQLFFQVSIHSIEFKFTLKKQSEKIVIFTFFALMPIG